MAGGRTRSSAPIPDDCKLHAGLVDKGWAVVAAKERECIDSATGLMRAAPRKPKPVELRGGPPARRRAHPHCRLVCTSVKAWEKQIEEGTIRYSPDFNAMQVEKTVTSTNA